MRPGIVEPVPRPLQVRLRRAVLEHATNERRRTFAPVLHLGTPGGVVATFCAEPNEGPLDLALRTEVVHALWRRSRAGTHDRPAGNAQTLAWLARPGDLTETRDDDLAWHAAVRAARGELGRYLPFVVVNRRAWRDPVTGAGRTWQRLRDRRETDRPSPA
ncbi:hypothetical protein [Nocardioides nanhaiensis]|uniref:Uncharacterized protein n=1 Tax=Nocardioides nanhaiensis TaxID=1476871 RepID=A0ABP8X0X6_9ACTN